MLKVTVGTIGGNGPSEISNSTKRSAPGPSNMIGTLEMMFCMNIFL